ncbi:MAG TPA: hypothetical protein VFJ43_03850, partial [Bacteroidia bacterium]|nr:hypothetical protein [Bacteroidia bacterium]
IMLTNDSLRPKDMDAPAEFTIGVTATDKNGNFTLFFDESEWRKPDQQVGPYQLIAKANDAMSWTLLNASLPASAISFPPINYSGIPQATDDRITGRLISQYDGKPVKGYLIEVWRSETDADYWVGNAMSGDDGGFIVPTQSLKNKTQINLVFKLFDGDNFLYQTYPKSYTINQGIVNAEIMNPYFGANVVYDPIILRGRILDETTSMPLMDTQIAFWEKDKGREYASLQFGTRTDDNGNFEIKINLPEESITNISHTWFYKIFLKDKISFEPPGTFKWRYNEKEKQLDIKFDTSQKSFGMAKEYYVIQGKLTNSENGKPLRGCNVEAWDKDDAGGDDLLGIAKTDLNGDYEIIFDSHYFRDLIDDNDPDIYFKVYQEKHLLLQDDVTWDVKTKVFLKDLQATPLERMEVSGQRGPLKENVYKTLSETLYPWNFPFNLHEAEGSLYLKKLGIDKEQLIVALNPGIDTRLGEALAFLQMTREELESLKSTSVKLLYGLGDDEHMLQLNDVPVLLNTIRISFDTLKELIQTDYVNPLKKEILFLSDRTLLEFNKNEYLNLHRLSRLKSKCGWQAKELEQIIRLYESRFGAMNYSVVSSGTVDPKKFKTNTIESFIIYIANFKKLLINGGTISDVLAWQFDLHLFRELDGEIYFKKIFHPEPS